MQSYKELIVWQKSINLVIEIYKIANQLPNIETYGLASQMRRAAVAIPSNIAEGYKRKHRKEFIQFLSIADGSAAELETQLILLENLYSEINISMAKNLLIEIMKMLNSMIAKLNQK